MSAKYLQIAETIKRQIRNGDFLFEKVPSPRKLAENNGVSYLTARRAVQQLIDDRVFIRSENGRLRVAELRVGAETEDSAEHRHGGLRIAYICHYSSADTMWSRALRRVAGARGGLLREVCYVHHDDPIIMDALDGDFDLIFLQHFDIPPPVLRKVQRLRARVVTMFIDLTEHGVRCVDGAHPVIVKRLVRHLRDLGHRRVDCLLADSDSVSLERSRVWRKALEEMGLEGELHRNVPEDRDEARIVSARRYTARLLERGAFRSTSVFCATVEDAVGVIRSLYDHRIKVPDDVSVVSFGSLVQAESYTPSITVAYAEDPSPTYEELIARNLDGDTEKLMFRTTTSEPIFHGESTAPPKAR